MGVGSGQTRGGSRDQGDDGLRIQFGLVALKVRIRVWVDAIVLERASVKVNVRASMSARVSVMVRSWIRVRVTVRMLGMVKGDGEGDMRRRLARGQVGLVDIKVRASVRVRVRVRVRVLAKTWVYVRARLGVVVRVRVMTAAVRAWGYHSALWSLR